MTPGSLARLAALIGGLAACGVGGCGRGDALVGGACASGYTQCGNTCVDLSTDPTNCGGCDVACVPGIACVAGACAEGPYAGGGHSDAGEEAGEAAGDATARRNIDATGIDGASGDRPGVDAWVGDGPASDAPATDDSGIDAPASDAPALDGSSSDGLTDAAEDASMAEAASVDAAPDGDSSTLQCNEPLYLCGNSCIDVQTDPNNCGACDNVCASSLCSGGTCQGATPGDDIVIGHDYLGVSATSAEARVLANAALLHLNSPLRILSFEAYADSATVANAKAIISAAAATRGRTLAFTATTSGAYIPSNLTVRNFDVLLVHDQANASAQTLSALGSSWASTLATYLTAGGVIITLDGGKGNGQMPTFLTQSMLLGATSHTVLAPGTAFTVAAPGDAVAIGVLSPYGTVGQSTEMSTDTANSSTVYVVVNPVDNLPVVIHKLVN